MMAKFSEYTALAASGVAATDKLLLYDASASAEKTLPWSDVAQAALLLSTGFAVIGATNKLSLGPNGATTPAALIDGSAASMVNGVSLTGKATTVAPIVAAIGSDTNITLELAGKGSAAVMLSSPLLDKVTQTALTNTATVTAAQLLTKILDGTPTGAATYTLPTAALLVAAIPGCKVGAAFDFLVNNKSGGANTITVAAGAGGTADGTLTVAQDVIRRFTVIITNVTAASEAYFVYGIGA